MADKSSAMEIIEGKQNGSQLHVYNNYTYCRDNRYDHIYRCSKRRTEKCSAVLEKEGESYTLKHRHNHSEKQYIVEIHKMKKEMVHLCKETTESPRHIFDTVSRNNLRIAPYLSYNGIKSILSRYRAKSRPDIPVDLHSLHEQLKTYIPTSNIYKSYATSSDNKIALIFSNDVLLNILSEACEIFVDGTFSIVPKKPSIAQLYTIHVRYIDTGIATVFVLCEARSASLYKAMWEKIVSLAPGLNKNLKFIMADYEKAAISAMSEQFPTVAIHGCWFHYSQALVRRWRRLGLDDAPSELLSMAKTMALAPSDLFEESLNIMQIFSNNLTNKYPAIADFMQYIKNTWLPIASKVSVYGCPNRTNNLVESFYGSIKKLGPTSFNLWKFLDGVNNLIINQTLNYERLQLGHSLKRLQTKFHSYKNRKIEQAQINLVTGRISLQQFLQIFVRTECKEKISEEYTVDCFYPNDTVTESVREYAEDDCVYDNNMVSMINDGCGGNDSISSNILRERVPEYEGDNCVYDDNSGCGGNDSISSNILTERVSEYEGDNCVYDDNSECGGNNSIFSNILTERFSEYEGDNCVYDDNSECGGNNSISSNILTERVSEYEGDNCVYDDNSGCGGNNYVSSDILTEKGISGKGKVNNNYISIKNMKKVKISLSRLEDTLQNRRRIPLRDKTNTHSSSKTTNKTFLAKKIAVRQSQNCRNRRTSKNKRK